MNGKVIVTIYMVGATRKKEDKMKKFRNELYRFTYMASVDVCCEINKMICCLWSVVWN